MKREIIINDLSELLRPLARNLEIFITPSFEREDLPLIIIKDTDDSVSEDAFTSISHSLNIEIQIITATYRASNETIKAILEALKGFKSAFLTISQTSLNRESFALYDDEYILSSISLLIKYKTRIWEA